MSITNKQHQDRFEEWTKNIEHQTQLDDEENKRLCETDEIYEEFLVETRENIRNDPVNYILDERYTKKIIFVHGNEDKCDWIFHNLVERAGNDIKFIPESLIKGTWDADYTFPFHNIETAKYLVVSGITKYDDLNKGQLKSLSGSDDIYGNI